MEQGPPVGKPVQLEFSAYNRSLLEPAVTRVRDIVPAGNGLVIVAEVVHIHVDPSVWRDGRVQPDLLDPVCRLAGTSYGRLGEIFKLPRPSWQRDVEGTQPGEAIPRRGT